MHFSSFLPFFGFCFSLFFSRSFFLSFFHTVLIANSEFSTEPAPFSFKLGWGLTTPTQSSTTSSPTTFLHQSPSTTITTTTAASTSTENLSALTTNHVRHSTDIRDPADSCNLRFNFLFGFFSVLFISFFLSSLVLRICLIQSLTFQFLFASNFDYKTFAYISFSSSFLILI